MNEKLVVAIDFESYYKEKHCSIKEQGILGYINHPEFDAYLVSVVTEDGKEFCGHPSDFDFNCLQKYDWLSHNKGFDQTLYRFLQKKGIIDAPEPERWYCTADLVAYHGIARDLATALHFVFEVEMDKSVRDRMNGKRWKDLTPEEQGELVEYCLDDSRWLPKLWRELSPGWPEAERKISDLTFEMKNRGLPIDAVKLDKSIRHLNRKMFEMVEDIPWWDAPTKKNKTPLSDVLMAEECRKNGLPVPSSRSKDSQDAAAWIEEYGEKYPFIEAMQNWASANTLLQKLLTLQDRIVFPDDGDFAWMPYGLKYCGAHTGRDAGGDGFNALNLHKAEIFGVDLRSHIVPPPGYRFLWADFSQIEPRVLAWLVEDEEFLERLRAGEDPYVAFGLGTLGHKGEWGSADRQLWKVMVLQLGYGSGWKKFMEVALKYGVELTPAEAKRLVYKVYQKKNKRVKDFWKELETNLRRASITKGGSGTFIIPLPNGRTQIYRNVRGNSNLQAIVCAEKGFMNKHLYGGLLCENVVQAIARDVFMDKYLELEDEGFPIVLRVYDEYLSLVREDEAEERRVQMGEIMRKPVPWAPDLPLAAEAKIIDFYQKD